MKKLKIKVFVIIFSIFSLVIISVSFISNVRNYYAQRRELLNVLNRHTIDFKDKEMYGKEPNDFPLQVRDEPTKIFLDYTVYTIILDSNGNYLDVVNHTSSDIEESYVKKIAVDIIDNHKSDIYVGNLFFNRFSYSFTKNGTLVIVDNISLNNRLCSSLFFSFMMAFVLEIIVWVISYLLTNWVIKPVEASFERQKRFIEDASHELKTPLTIMMASSDAFNKDGDKKWIDNMRNECERMTSLVTELLDLSEIENERNLNFKVEDLSNIIESSVLTFESLFYESNLKLEYSIEPDISLNCNKNQIKQLITILIDNAIKYSEDTGSVFINLCSEGRSVVLEVKNKGVAIKEGEEEKIFERFYKSDISRNRDGNNYGLGLAILKSIVINHNGVVSVKSSEGYTTFKVKFD